MPPVCDGDHVFQEISSSAILHVPVGCKDAYAAATGWLVFSNIIDNLESDIEDIETDNADADDNVVVYNLQGLRMNIPAGAARKSS